MEYTSFPSFHAAPNRFPNASSSKHWTTLVPRWSGSLGPEKDPNNQKKKIPIPNIRGPLYIPTTFLSEFSAVYLPLLHLLMDQSWAPPWKNPFAFWVENGKNSRNGDLSPFILPHREKQFKNICVTLWNCFTRWRKRAFLNHFSRLGTYLYRPCILKEK